MEVRALRVQLGVTQQALSHRSGMCQQTVSEWEVGKHRPRGAGLTLLNLIAEGAGFAYHTDPRGQTGEPPGGMVADAAMGDGDAH